MNDSNAQFMWPAAEVLEEVGLELAVAMPAAWAVRPMTMDRYRRLHEAWLEEIIDAANNEEREAAQIEMHRRNPLMFEWFVSLGQQGWVESLIREPPEKSCLWYVFQKTEALLALGFDSRPVPITREVADHRDCFNFRACVEVMYNYGYR